MLIARGRTRTGGVALVLLAFVLSACGQQAQSVAPESQAAQSQAPAPSVEAPPEALQLAFLSFAVANSYDAPMLAEAQNAAAQAGAILTVFDANNSVEAQVAQLQDAIASGQYDGIIVQPIFGQALIPDIEAAIADGMHIAVLDQILGADLTTSEKQVDGLAANVVFVQSEIGRKQGELVVQACDEFELDPCNVGFIWSLKGVSALDIAIDAAFNAVIAEHDHIEVVAEGESFYTTHFGLTVTENMLVARPDINVIVGADQGITGAVIAIENAERTGDIVLIGYGGAAIAYQRIAAGGQYATVAQRPATEGRYVVEDLIAAIESGEPSDSRDPVSELPDDGIVTQDNVADFTAEWPG